MDRTLGKDKYGKSRLPEGFNTFGHKKTPFLPWKMLSIFYSSSS